MLEASENLRLDEHKYGIPIVRAEKLRFLGRYDCLYKLTLRRVIELVIIV